MTVFVLISLIILYLGYRYYGGFLEKLYRIEEKEVPPSVEIKDGVDYVPSNKWVLIGHHFSSIAGAGPIVGPIIAGIYFGWVPAFLWIIVGCIFIGIIHDFSSLIISLRHKGKSIAEIARIYINKKTYKIFLLFIWFALVYVVAVFTDITASTFSTSVEVSEISIIYIIVAVLFGYFNYKIGFNKVLLTIGALILIVAGIILSFKFKIIVLDRNIWVYVLLFYAFLASILPVWILLQPRDYLSSFLLYFSVIIGLLGLIGGGYKLSYPAYISFSSDIGPLFPFLFVTIACGAVSGFHSLVSSGTTSKQIDSFKNAKFVGAGSMICEGIVAIIALSTLMMIGFDKSVYSKQPAEIYAMGVSKFVSIFGINESFGRTLGFLIISGFVLTTLDTATRIARYIGEEFFGITKTTLITRVVITLLSLLLPLLLLNLKIKNMSGNIIPCWKLIWPIFGITNQLLAALVLLIIYLWVKKENISKRLSILLPAIFMLISTIYALGIKIYEFISRSSYNVAFYISVILFILAVFVIFESYYAIKKEDFKEVI